MSGAPEGYVEVHERVEQFFQRYPEGSFQGDYEVVSIGEQTLIVYRSSVYRTPDDKRPAVAFSAEPFPGKTPFTKDSELENAETSAIGRALAALGFEVHRSMASANEVRSRQGDSTPRKPGPGPATEGQRKFLSDLLRKQGVNAQEQVALVKAHTSGEALSKGEAGTMIDALTENASAALAGWRAEL